MNRRLASGLMLVSAVAFGLTATVLAQGTVSGLVQGSVLDQEGGVLPGATVTAMSEALVAGRQVAVADRSGGFRFPSLPPGVYVVEVELAGFRTVRMENVRVALGQALRLDVRMELAPLAEEIVVTADAAQVSVVSNTVSSNLTQEYLDRQPLPRSVNALVNYAPGVNNMLAYGGTQSATNAFNLDGVDVSNPASGEHWILPNFDWIQEVQVTGLGADAEFGGFTGAVFNLVTRSGGNQFQGDLTLYYTDKDFVSSNQSGVAKQDFSYADASISLGGAITRDRLWYFVSANRVQDELTPFGAERSTEITLPRYIGKLTFQPDPKNRLIALANYDGKFQERRGIGAFTLASGSTKQESDNVSYNLTWESLLSDRAFTSVKYTGFRGNDDRLPYFGDTPGRYDVESGLRWGNSRWTDRRDYQRQTLDASWNLFADGLLAARDSHNLKFGINYERGKSDELSTRNGGFSYYDDSWYCDSLDDYFANPFCGVNEADFGDDILLRARQSGLHLYAQDSLRLGRVTVNAGVRYTRYEAGFSNARKDVYDVDVVAPRVGVVWDLFGTAKTALKAHYGRYYEGMFSYMYDREITGEVFTPAYYCQYNFSTGRFDRNCSAPVPNFAALDGGIKHPYVDQYVATFEQEVGRNSLIALDYVHRKNGNILAKVNTNDDYESLVAPGNPFGGVLPFFDLMSGQDFLITNPEGAFRKYDSVVLRFDRRYADGWLLRASLVWADLRGNTFKANSYVPEWEDRNGQTNARGTLPGFSEWEFKLSGSVDLWWGIEASAYYTFLSGEYWTPSILVRGLYRNDRQSVYLTERGSQQLPDRNLVDLKLAKNLNLGSKVRLKVFVDVFNVFNSDTILDRSTQWGTYRYNWRDHPDGSTWQPSATYGQATRIERPREIRLGARLSF